MTTDPATRNKILSAAKSCFKRYGFERTRMEDVAHLANVSRKTVYNYFPGRNELIAEFIAEEGGRLVAKARKQIDWSLSPDEIIVDAQIALMRTTRANPYFHVVFAPNAVQLSATVVGESDIIRQAVTAYWEPILARLEDQGHIVVDDYPSAMEWLMYILFALLARSERTEEPARVRELLLRYLTPALMNGADRVGSASG